MLSPARMGHLTAGTVLQHCRSLVFRAPATALAAKQRTAVRRKALQDPSNDDRPTLPISDEALQSLIESGIRGTLAVVVASAVHVNVFDFHPDAGDAVTGLRLMLPVLLADALLLRAGPPATKVEAALSAPAWLQAYRRHVLRYSVPQARSPGGQLGLEALAQLSEEMLARCTLLAGLGAWLADVGHEAGAAEGVSLAGAYLTTEDFCLWAAMAVITTTISARYVQKSLEAYREQKRLPPPAAAAPLAAPLQGATASSRGKGDQQQPKPRRVTVEDLAPKRPGAAPADAPASAAALQAAAKQLQAATQPAPAPAGGSGGGNAAGRQPWWLPLLLGGRFVAAQAALYAAFIVTHNAASSFVAGLAMQLLMTAYAGLPPARGVEDLQSDANQ